MVYHAETIATHLWHYVPIICNSHYATPENEWRIATFVAQNVNKGKIYTLFNIYSAVIVELFYHSRYICLLSRINLFPNIDEIISWSYFFPEAILLSVFFYMYIPGK